MKKYGREWRPRFSLALFAAVVSTAAVGVASATGGVTRGSTSPPPIHAEIVLVRRPNRSPPKDSPPKDAEPADSGDRVARRRAEQVYLKVTSRKMFAKEGKEKGKAEFIGDVKLSFPNGPPGGAGNAWTGTAERAVCEYNDKTLKTTLYRSRLVGKGGVVVSAYWHEAHPINVCESRNMVQVRQVTGQAGGKPHQGEE